MYNIRMQGTSPQLWWRDAGMGAAKQSDDVLEDRRRRCRWRRLHLSLVQFGLVALFVASACFRIWTAAASTRVLKNEFDARVLRSGNAAGIRQPRRLNDVGFQASDGGVGLVVELHEDDRQCGNIGKLPRERRCEHARRYCKGSRSIVNYVALHHCTLNERAWLSMPLIAGAIMVSFFWLAETAENYFSPVAGLMVEMLKMSPTMGGVTLLALGNGAPDVFASMAAIGGGNSRIGLGAIISAGTFVSAFVVGSVALMAAPFPVKPLPFVRDVLFYTTAVALLFILYLKGVVTFWQAVGLMLFYVVFIVVVVFMDQVKGRHGEENQPEKTAEAAKEDAENGDFLASFQHDGDASDNSFMCNQDSCSLATLVESAKLLLASPAKLWGKLAIDISTKGSSILSSMRKTKVKSVLQAPLRVILRATIPEINPSKWNRVYATANVVSCPLLVLFMFRSAISLDYQVAFFLPIVQLPLWSLVLVQNLFLAVAFFLSAKQPPDSTQLFVAFMAFVMSVFWISFIAGELLGCLAALGLVLGVSPSLLGLTILAWGNSMGDLVADIAIARAGKPDMAIAGCFAGPMFNMLVGLGFALVLHTSYLQSGEYYLPYHPSIIIAFGFLFASLLGSLVVVACSRFQVTRTWGLCLICLYFIFTIVSLFAANIPL